MKSRILKLIESRPCLTVAVLTLLVCSTAYLVLPNRLHARSFGDHNAQVKDYLAGSFANAQTGQVSSRTPPLYPMALVAATKLPGLSPQKPARVVFLLNGLCLVAAASLVCLIACQFLKPWCGVTAGALFACHPQLLSTLIQPISMPLFLVFLYGSLFFLLQVRPDSRRLNVDLGVCGALLALAILTRPIALFLPPVFAILVAWRCRQQLRCILLPTALFVVTVVVFLAPWLALTYVKNDGQMSLSSSGHRSLRDGFSFNHKAHRQTLALPPAVRAFSDRAWARYESLDSTGATLKFVLDTLRENPAMVIQTYVFKAVRCFYGTDSQSQKKELANLVLFVGLLIPVLVGVWQLRGTPAMWLMVVLGLLTLYFWAMATAVLSIVRYLVPMLGLWLIVVPIGTLGIFRRTAANALRQPEAPGEQRPETTAELPAQ